MKKRANEPITANPLNFHDFTAYLHKIANYEDYREDSKADFEELSRDARLLLDELGTSGVEEETWNFFTETLLCKDRTWAIRIFHAYLNEKTMIETMQTVLRAVVAFYSVKEVYDSLVIMDYYKDREDEQNEKAR